MNVELKPQLRQYRAQQAFARNIGRLWLELRLGTPRRHLDVLVDLLETLLPECGKTQLGECYRAELYAAKLQVAQRSNLRLVK